MAELAFGHPFFRQLGRGGEAVIQVDAVADAFFACLGDHFFGFVDLVGDGLFAENVAARFEREHGGLEVVGAVLVAAGGDADDVGFEVCEHFRRVPVNSGNVLSREAAEVRAVFLRCRKRPTSSESGSSLIDLRVPDLRSVLIQ